MNERTNNNVLRDPSTVIGTTHRHASNGDVMAQRYHRGNNNVVTSYLTSSKPVREGASFATHLLDNTGSGVGSNPASVNNTNLTDSRSLRETERRFLNDTPSVAPYRFVLSFTNC